MTYRQYGTLKYIQTHEVGTEYVRALNLTTFGSLLQHGWIERRGTEIELTKSGQDAFDQYSKATCNFRKIQGNISARVALMLNLKHLRNGAA